MFDLDQFLTTFGCSDRMDPECPSGWHLHAHKSVDADGTVFLTTLAPLKGIDGWTALGSDVVDPSGGRWAFTPLEDPCTSVDDSTGVVYTTTPGIFIPPTT